MQIVNNYPDDCDRSKFAKSVNLKLTASFRCTIKGNERDGRRLCTICGEFKCIKGCMIFLRAKYTERVKRD